MAAAVDDPEANRLFWFRHLQLGFLILIPESAVLLLYFSVTPGRHRPLQLAIAASTTLAGGLALTRLVERVSHQPWRETFSLVWTVSCGVSLAIVAFLDGGFESPLLILIPLPVVFAGLAFSPRRVALVGVCEVAEFAAVSLGGPADPPGGELLVWASGVVGIAGLAVAAAVNRTRLERIERALGRQLAQLAATDGLTGCLNHRAFIERLEEEIRRAVRHGGPLAVLVADIDDFKRINDTHGHSTGDDVLVAVASALCHDLRSGDFVGRMDGDEFVMALPDTPMSGATARAARVQECLRTAHTIPVTLSIGIASLDSAQPSSRQLLEEADRALYHVKQTGRFGIATASSGTARRIAG